MKRDELKHFLYLSSFPIRKLKDLSVRGSATGCIVYYKNKFVLLTVAHAVGEEGDWAIEVEFDPHLKQTKLYRPGPFTFLSKVNLTEKTHQQVDFAFTILHEEITPLHQNIEMDGTITSSHEIFKLVSDFSVMPSPEKEYGFFGHTRVKPLGNLLTIDPRLEMGMKYVKTQDDLYIFDLTRENIKAADYKGCSGAPILDNEGNLVSLVVEVGVDIPTIYGLPLPKYKAAIDAECDQIT